MSEQIIVIARITKINPAHNQQRVRTFELEPLAIVEMYPPKPDEETKDEQP